MVSDDAHPMNPDHFRRTMARYPTGVALVTATTLDGESAAMVVGTVASVSLDPPLVSFMPAITSTTWPSVEAAGAFCINVLGMHQEDVCRSFGARTPDRFSSQRWSTGPSGSPVLEGSVAWIDCTIENVVRAGDHYIVIGRVLAMAASEPSDPLLFLRGGYGSFVARAQVAADPEFAPFVGAMDRIRPQLERLADRFGCECVVGGRIESGEVVILASAGGRRGSPVSGLLGRRIATAAPFGRTMLAWADDVEVDSWVSTRAAADAARFSAMLDVVRERGYSVSVFREGPIADSDEATAILDPGTEAPPGWSGEGPVHSLSAPILDASGRAEYVLAMYGLDDVVDADLLAEHADALVTTSRALSHRASYEASFTVRTLHD